MRGRSLPSLLAAVGLFSSAIARGQCPGVSTGPEYKVVLDDIVPATSTDSSALQYFMEHVRFQFQANLQQLQLESDQIIRVERCEGHRPADGDFTPDLTRNMNARNVLLEIWGAAGLEHDSSGRARHQALLHFALIPVYRYKTELPGWPSICDAQLQSQGDLSPEFELFDRARQLKAYFAVSAGVKSLKDGDYDQAKKFLCRGEALLAESPPPAPGSMDGILLQRVRSLQDETLADAKRDSAYRGPLRLVSTTPGRSVCSAP